MSTYSYPGVYVEEDHSLSLSVRSGATAVPAFVCAQDEFDALWKGKGAYVRVDSWLDVATAAMKGAKDAASGSGAGADAATNGAVPRKRAKRGTDEEKGAAAEDSKTNSASAATGDAIIQTALRAYFENGGGYCYVLAFEEGQRLDAVRELNDVTLLVEAGCNAGTAAQSTAVKVAIANHCNLDTGIFGIYDGIRSKGKTEGLPASAYGAAYVPWLNRPDTNAAVPPSAVMAGVYCTVDHERGVWKAPANIAIRGGLTLAEHYSDAEQGVLNMSAAAINVIRRFGPGAPVVWGARTLSTEDEGGKWKYIPVRRLFNAVEKDVRQAMRFAVSEPNNAPTWERVRAAIDSYLHALWKQGGLMGATPQQAYSVLIGKGVTMTADDIANGEMIVQVGLAAVRPAEFIVLRFSQEVGL